MGFRRVISTGLAGVCLIGVAFADEGRLAPEPTELRWIEASIRALHDNGVAQRVARDHGIRRPDGVRALPLKHVVACEARIDCDRVARWARRSGLLPSAILTRYGHGGQPHYEVHLRQRVPLVSRQVQAEALRVHEALASVPGARYETWMLDVVLEGNRVAR